MVVSRVRIFVTRDVVPGPWPVTRLLVNIRVIFVAMIKRGTTTPRWAIGNTYLNEDTILTHEVWTHTRFIHLRESLLLVTALFHIMICNVPLYSVHCAECAQQILLLKGAGGFKEKHSQREGERGREDGDRGREREMRGGEMIDWVSKW